MTRAGVVIVVAALALGGAIVLARAGSTPARPDGAAAGGTAPSTMAPVSVHPSTPTDPNEGWFVGPLPGGRLRGNEVVDDPDLFPLYFDDAEAEVYERQGVEVVRVRSYFAGSSGGGVITVIPADRPRAVLRGLDRIGGGLGRPYPRLTDGHIRRRVVQMESTRAHDVFAHFFTISFVEGRYAVIVEGYGISDAVGRRRAVHYATAQRDLLAARD